jgi:hypothetical protein
VSFQKTTNRGLGVDVVAEDSVSDRVPDVGILDPVPSGTGVDANFTHLNIVLQKYRDMEGPLAGLAVSAHLVCSSLKLNGAATPA